MARLEGLARYLVNQEFAYRELQRQYDVGGIYNIVQHWIDNGGLGFAIGKHFDNHDGQCELEQTGYRNCDCWRRRAISPIEPTESNDHA